MGMEIQMMILTSDEYILIEDCTKVADHGLTQVASQG